MIRIITLSFFIVLFLNAAIAQNEFGAVGSYWQYSFEPHNGSGGGWTSITIEKDTTINGEAFKKYRRKHYYKSFMDPAIETTNIGFLQIKNDSVFNEVGLILDFDMNLSDSLYVKYAGGNIDIQLAIDSITVEQIGGFEYRKWHGQKICIEGPNGTEPYESFTILETVGQIDNEFLFWNTDNCSIGGGLNKFSCYKNGAFTYPLGVECKELVFTSTKNLSIENSIEIFPNPANDLLNVKFKNSKAKTISILNLEGRELFRKKVNNQLIELEVNGLEKGIYFLKIRMDEKVLARKFVKQ